jgi:hypothetical protein
MTRSTDLLSISRAAALFSSDLPAGLEPTLSQVEAAIRRAICTYGGVLGCTAELAAAYGERPETAAPRMRWALRTVKGLYDQTGRHTVPVPAPVIISRLRGPLATAPGSGA